MFGEIEKMVSSFGYNSLLFFKQLIQIDPDRSGGWMVGSFQVGFPRDSVLGLPVLLMIAPGLCRASKLSIPSVHKGLGTSPRIKLGSIHPLGSH